MGGEGNSGAEVRSETAYLFHSELRDECHGLSSDLFDLSLIVVYPLGHLAQERQDSTVMQRAVQVVVLATCSVESLWLSTFV